MFLELMDRASKRGFRWDRNRDFVGFTNGQIMYQRHIPVVFRAAFLRAMYGGEWRRVAHEALDAWMDGGNPMALLLDVSDAFERKRTNPNETK